MNINPKSLAVYAILPSVVLLAGCFLGGDWSYPFKAFHAVQNIGPQAFSGSARVESTLGLDPQTTYTVNVNGKLPVARTFDGYTHAFITTDLDNDGEIGDGVFALPAEDRIVVVRLASGELLAPAFYPTGDNPQTIAHGDLNGDGILDLVTANAGNFASGDVSVLFAEEDGKFGEPVQLSMGSVPLSAFLGHFDEDEHLDIVASDASSARVVMRTNNGDGTFGDEISIALSVFPRKIAVADLNPDIDDFDDVLAGAEILWGNGDGTFSEPERMVPELSPNLSYCFDLNEDGVMDIVLGSGTPKMMTILINNGDGTFQMPRHLPLTSIPEHISFGDYGGEGLPDLIATNAADDTTVYHGVGGGQFLELRAFPVVSNISDRLGADGAAVADFTGDGILDIVATNHGNLVGAALSGKACSLLEGDGQNAFLPFQPIDGLPGSDVVSGDWDGDDKADLALVGVGPSTPQLFIALGNGDGTFEPFASTDLPGENRNDGRDSVIATALVNNTDSDADLLVCNYGGGNLSVLLGDGSGGFSRHTVVEVGPRPTGVAVGDLNHDGATDVVVSYEGDAAALNGGAVFALGNGDGSFGEPQELRDSVAVSGVVLEDFDGDMNLDVALSMERASFDWDVEIIVGNGDGTFGQPMSIGLSESLIRGIATSDGDLDGVPDLIVPLAGDSICLLRGLGDGNFITFFQPPVGGGSVFSTDINKDGYPDIVAPTGEGYVSVYINDLRRLGVKGPPLFIRSSEDEKFIKIGWPAFYPDYILKESSDLQLPFVDSELPIREENNLSIATFDPQTEASPLFFTLGRSADP